MSKLEAKLENVNDLSREYIERGNQRPQGIGLIPNTSSAARIQLNQSLKDISYAILCACRCTAIEEKA